MTADGPFIPPSVVGAVDTDLPKYLAEIVMKADRAWFDMPRYEAVKPTLIPKEK